MVANALASGSLRMIRGADGPAPLKAFRQLQVAAEVENGLLIGVVMS